MFRSIQQQKNAVSDPGMICDIHDGTLYKSLAGQGGILHSPHNISMLLNTIDNLKKDKSYRLKNALVSEYGGRKYLSVTEDAIIEEVTDIGMVATEEEEYDEQLEEQSVEGEIVAVVGVDNYFSCINCYGKVKLYSHLMGECMKCASKVKLSSCKEQTSSRFIYLSAISLSLCIFFIRLSS